MKEERLPQFTLDDSEFQFVCRFVYDETGIVLDERKREMTYRRLMRRTRELKIPSFSAYCKLLKSGDKNEKHKFINAITTNLTSFFREKHHFDYLENQYLKNLMEENKENRLRIWSAGCSTGEEAYSIAITLLQTFSSRTRDWDIKILATDLDTDVLNKGKKGVYPYEKISDLPDSIKKKWFYKSKEKTSDNVKMRQELIDLITFKQLNLLDEWPIKGPFDVIFCRNVMIYFDKETQNHLISRYHRLLKPNGLLIIGHSESIGQQKNNFDSLGKTIFRKTSTLKAEAQA